MNVRAGHPMLVMLAGIDSGRFHVGGEVFLNCPKILELLVEMAGKQQYGVLQFAQAAVQRTLAEVACHDRGADRDFRDQEYAAQDQPADPTASEPSLDVEGGDAGWRHPS